MVKKRKEKGIPLKLLLSLSGLNWTFSIKSKSYALIFPSAQFDKYGLQKKR